MEIELPDDTKEYVYYNVTNDTLEVYYFDIPLKEFKDKTIVEKKLDCGIYFDVETHHFIKIGEL